MTAWTPQSIPDLTGRTAVVTGANSGLGHEVSARLAAHGAHIVLACRDERRGAEALAQMAGSAELMLLDLASLASIRQFAGQFSDAHASLDLLVCNAGVMATPHRSTADGFELQFGTNHLGHFALTGALLPRLLIAARPRVVVVSSQVHWLGALIPGDLTSNGWYNKWLAYGRSKLANLVFMYELQRRAVAAGTALLSVGAHPGWTATNLQATGPRMAGSVLGVRVATLANRVLSQSAAMGALPLLRAATDPQVRPADFFGPGGLGHLHGLPDRDRFSRRARDPRVGRALWETSERLTDITYRWAAES